MSDRDLRVWFNGRTSAFQADDVGSIPITRSKFYAHVAQSVEHFLGKEEVTGSNPVMGSILLVSAAVGGVFVFD